MDMFNITAVAKSNPFRFRDARPKSDVDERRIYDPRFKPMKKSTGPQKNKREKRLEGRVF